MKEDNTTEINTKNEASKIDAIKQLIFGDQIQSYDSEFEALKKDILEKKKSLEIIIDSVKEELIQSIDSISTDINIRVTELEDRIEEKIEILDENTVDRKMLGELFTKLGQKISE